MKATFVALSCILFFTYSMVHAERTIWYVHPDSALNSIQAGLDSCADNDIVLVGPGTYYENLMWPNTQGIDLISEYGPDTTIMDGGGNDRVIMINTGVDTATKIDGFTIQNGKALSGGGIYCHSSSPHISNNIIASNSGYSGGGISCDSASPVIADNTITDNNVLSYGGGIYCTYSSPTITNNTISHNMASNAGGIGCSGHSSPTIIGNNIIENVAIDVAGGIDCNSYSSPIIVGNTITGNTAYWSAGIQLIDCAPTIDSNTISNNIAEESGGGIACMPNTTPIITNNTIIGNIVNFKGGGILSGGIVNAYSSPVITGNIIIENTGGYGAAIYCDRSTAIIDSCTISNNNGDGLFIEEGCTPTVVIHNSNIVGNSGYGVRNLDANFNVTATYNWWGDPRGPGGVGPGTGDEVSNYVIYIPWLTEPAGIVEENITFIKSSNYGATIFSGPLILPEGKKCKVFDISGRIVAPTMVTCGIYFIEVDRKVVQKVIKIK